MMRDICARFKYTERDVVAENSPVLSTPRLATTDRDRTASDQSVDSMEYAAPATPNGEPSTLPSPIPLPPSTPSNCPSRELIHRTLRGYYRMMEGGESTLATLAERMVEDLSLYSVVKLGGFSLGNIAPKLLATVLTKSDNIRTLDLGFNRINDRGATLLAKALESNRSLKSLYLSGNDIGPQGAAAIAAALATNDTLQSLHLSGNNIGEEGAQALAEGLKANTGLRSLYIGTNGIGTNGTKSLADSLQINQHLEELTLGQNKIGSDGLKFLAAAFATGRVKLTTLEVGKNGIDADGVISLAKALCNPSNRLQNLYIDINPLGDIGAGAFGALLAKNGILRVLDLSYTQMSLLGLRDLSMGLSYSSSLLCLLLDGHDWASTQYMKKTNGLNGMTLSAKGASNFAASCIVGAINSNAKSVLYKLTGVDLTLIVHSLPISATERASLSGETGEGVSGSRRPVDMLSRNERILKYLQEQRVAAALSNKRKSADVESEQEIVEQDKETAERSSQRQKTATTTDNYPRLSVDTSMPPRPPTRPSPPSTTSDTPTGIRAHPSRSSLAEAQNHLRHPSWPVERRLAVKSPRYESTMEVQVRKVISDIAKMPFNADEYAALQTYYLGGCNSPKNVAGPAAPKPSTTEDASAPQPSPSSSAEVLPEKVAEQVPCPACRASRIAQYPRTMLFKAKLETEPDADKLLMVLLRQLHYLVGVFQHIEHAEQKIDALLDSIHHQSVDAMASTLH